MILKALCEIVGDGFEVGKLDGNTNIKLYGDGGVLDSMGLVNFVVSLEELIAAEGGSLVLSTDDLFGTELSHFNDINSLELHLVKLSHGG